MTLQEHHCSYTGEISLLNAEVVTQLLLHSKVNNTAVCHDIAVSNTTIMTL